MKITKIAFLLLLLVGFVSCKKDKSEVIEKKQKVELKAVLPLGLKDAEYFNRGLEVKSLTSIDNVKFSDTDFKDNVVTVELPVGRYTANFSASVKFKDDKGILKESKVSSSLEFIVTSSQSPLTFEVQPSYTPSTSGFVIEEIFYTSTDTPEGKPYFGSKDQYIKIYNNSNETLYADSLAFVVSEFMTINDTEYEPDVMSEAMIVEAIYVIGGDGDDHPIQPGESIILANDAMDHTKKNANSVDLSTANFEWFEESTNPKIQDVDNPDVPNLIRYYSNTKTIYSIHNRGFKSIAIARIPVNKDEFISEYKHDYTYTLVTPVGSFQMKGQGYKVLNKWILDAANVSTRDDFKKSVVDASLDSGYTYCLINEKDKSAKGTAVIRKTETTNNGRRILKDSNNSRDDFDPRVKASLIKK